MRTRVPGSEGLCSRNRVASPPRNNGFASSVAEVRHSCRIDTANGIDWRASPILSGRNPQPCRAARPHHALQHSTASKSSTFPAFWPGRPAPNCWAIWARTSTRSKTRPAAADDTRSWGPPFVTGADGKPTDLSAYFMSANRNKRSVAVDITSAEGTSRADEAGRRLRYRHRELQARRAGETRPRPRHDARRPSAPRLLLDLRLRPDRPERSQTRLRPHGAGFRRR